MATVNIEAEQIFVGRTEELRRVLENIRSGTHTLCVGKKGIGKSALLGHVLRALRGQSFRIELSERLSNRRAGRLASTKRPKPHVLVLTTTSPLGDCLRACARVLWEQGFLGTPERLRGEQEWDPVRKWFGGLGRIGQLDLIRASLERTPTPRVVVFDSLDRISPSHVRMLEDFFEVATVVAAVAHCNDASPYARIWSTFSRVEIGALSEAESHELIERLIGAYGIRPVDRKLLAREVLCASAGSPFHIRINLWKASRQGELDRKAIRTLRRSASGEYFNMGPIYIFGASIFTLYKILSIGMDNREFYIYFSALGFFVYLAFRVFRNFFLFRPQRKR
jgi:energy-coupling factor transporter ATP-binding protein EcfA2